MQCEGVTGRALVLFLLRNHHVYTQTTPFVQTLPNRPGHHIRAHVLMKYHMAANIEMAAMIVMMTKAIVEITDKTSFGRNSVDKTASRLSEYAAIPCARARIMKTTCHSFFVWAKNRSIPSMTIQYSVTSSKMLPW